MRLTSLAALPALALFLVPGPTATARAADLPAESPEPLPAWLALAPLPDAETASDAAGETLFVLDSGERGRPQELWSLPRSGGAALRLSGPLAPGERVGEFALSPDGRALAFTVVADGGPRRLFWTPAAGGAPRLVSRDLGPSEGVARFAFRPDSRAIGFVGRGDRAQVFALFEAIFSNGFESGDSAGWSDTTANPCPTPTGGPTLHASSILSNETWTANAGPHVLTSNVLVPPGVTLTIAPCAEVRVRPGFDLTVQGTLTAVGTPLQRIRFLRDVAASPWDSIWVKSPGTATLSFLDLSGGGAAGASIVAEGVDTLPAAQPLFVDHVKVIGSTSYGVRLIRRAAFADGSRDLVVLGAGATDPTAPFPVRMSLNTVGSLPVGSYTGNASDQIQVIGEGDSAVAVDDAFHARGVPYQVGGPAGAFGLIVVDGNPALATLTIDPGVEIRFYSAGSNIGGLFVGTSGSPVATGRLVAAGTAAAPILFTGAGGAPVAGSWEGITFFGALAAGNVLDHVQIDAAGDNGGDAGFGCPPAAFPETSGALKIFSPPGSSFLTHSTISRSSTHGVFRAWTGAQVDFMTGNTFDDVLFCNQVLPKPPLPAVCPANPECPQ